MAEACVQLLECPDEMLALLFPEGQAPLVNIGCGEDVTIRELALLIREVVGSDAEILWDRSKPDGTPRKLLDVSRLKQLGWRQTTMLREGIARAYADFLT